MRCTAGQGDEGPVAPTHVQMQEEMVSCTTSAGVDDQQNSMTPGKGCPQLVLPEQHAPRIAKDKRKLMIAIVLCFFFMLAEIAGGLASGSLSVMTDAAHLLSDIAGFLISLFALTWSTKPATTHMSFGYHRAEILGALLSIAMVWAMTIFLVIKAIERIQNPKEIEPIAMLAVAALGLVVNIVIVLTLHSSHDKHETGDAEQPTEVDPANGPCRRGHSMNIRAAVIHAIGDIVQSVGVLLAAVVIWLRPDWTLADPLCTFLFSALVFGSTLLVTKDAVHILMEGSPRDVDLAAMEADLKALPGVRGVHDLHVWSLAAGKPAATMHVLRQPEAESDKVLLQTQGLLCSKYNVHHATIQVESRIDTRYHCHSHLPGSMDHPEAGNLLPW